MLCWVSRIARLQMNALIILVKALNCAAVIHSYERDLAVLNLILRTNNTLVAIMNTCFNHAVANRYYNEVACPHTWFAIDGNRLFRNRHHFNRPTGCGTAHDWKVQYSYIIADSIGLHKIIVVHF